MVDFNVQSIGPTLPLKNETTAVGQVGKPEGQAFGQWLEKSIRTVNQMQREADTAAMKLANGENKDIHGTMISMQKADVAVNLMMEVRNKIIAAYDEVRRMQF